MLYGGFNLVVINVTKIYKGLHQMSLILSRITNIIKTMAFKDL